MDREDNSWVFDSLICFLNGPVWNAPLQSFIEEKSLIFEPNHADEKEYRKVFNEFRNLVDIMLGTYMDDIGITPEQFEIACNEGLHEKLPVHFPENLFEQIWAANDFEVFKRMMVQKNIELQLEALEMIEKKHGATSHLFSLDNETRTKESPLEKEVIVEVIKQCEAEELDSTENIATDIENASSSASVPEYLQQEKQLLETALHSSHDEMMRMFSKPIDTDINDVELKKRQEYLKSQRDKLVALKKQVRKKRLDTEIGNNKAATSPRPKSAKTAQALLSNEESEKSQTDVQPQTLKIRKALVDRFKSEVLEKKNNTD